MAFTEFSPNMSKEYAGPSQPPIVNSTTFESRIQKWRNDSLHMDSCHKNLLPSGLGPSCCCVLNKIVIAVIASQDDKYQASKENRKTFFTLRIRKDKRRIFRQGYSDTIIPFLNNTPPERRFALQYVPQKSGVMLQHLRILTPHQTKPSDTIRAQQVEQHSTMVCTMSR